VLDGNDIKIIPQKIEICENSIILKVDFRKYFGRLSTRKRDFVHKGSSDFTLADKWVLVQKLLKNATWTIENMTKNNIFFEIFGHFLEYLARKVHQVINLWPQMSVLNLLRGCNHLKLLILNYFWINWDFKFWREIQIIFTKISLNFTFICFRVKPIFSLRSGSNFFWAYLTWI